MRVRCAWCRDEGKPGVIGEKPPLDDPTETHGICRRHQRELLEFLPSRSFPGVDLLIVVDPQHEALFHYLERRWAGVRGVQVILDRRGGARRRVPQPSRDSERRRGPNRRTRESQPGVLGCVVIRFGRTKRSGGAASSGGPAHGMG